jgi:uncharacterized protein (TIGR03435 family)
MLISRRAESFDCLAVITAMKLACLCALQAAALFAQQPSFDVASVKPAPPPTGSGFATFNSGGPGTKDPSTVTYTNAALRDLVRLAYGVKDYQISAPAWLSSTRFDVVAKVPPDSTKEQVVLMWRSLLAERFKITSHMETKELPVYALVVSKSGPKLKESNHEDSSSNPRFVSQGGGLQTSGGSAPQVGFSAPRDDGSSAVPSGVHRMSGSKMPLSRLAEMLSRSLDRPVLDMTALTGRYDVQLSYSSEDSADAPSIFGALERQLGLKLEPRKSAVSIVVVDHAEKVPAEN